MALEKVDEGADGLNLSRYQWRTLWAATAGYAMDGLDLMVISYVMVALIKAFHLTPAQAGGIATVTLMGAVLGGYVFGILADRYGRVRTFSYSILIFAVFTGLTALSPNLAWLNITRFWLGSVSAANLASA